MRRRHWILTTAAVALVAVACSSSGDTAFEVVDTEEAFYEVPDPLPPGEPGDLIRVQPVEVDGLDDAQAWRVMYHSESQDGSDIAVTGIVFAPDGEAPDEGRPVLTWAHGTTGLADACAPSKGLDEGEAFDLAGEFLDSGFVVVGTDYEGLGTPGLHPYIAGESEGRGVLDIVPAARELTETAAGTQYAIWGHSQGGHAALFAGQLAADRLPDLELVGTVAGAPPYGLPALADVLRDGDFQGYLIMGAAGLNAAFPEAELELVLTDRALDLIDVLDEGCTDEIFDVYNPIPYDELALVDLNDVPVWQETLQANDPGQVAWPSPVLIIHGTEDEQIPVVASQLLFDLQCDLGQNVERRTYEGADHSGAVEDSFDEMLAWIEDRFAGVPAESGC